MNLTDAQKQAATTTGKNIIVSAGAGTGKTRVLVERFIHLVEQKLAKPAEILTITFTDKAAQEMKRRIADELMKRGLEDARREMENAYIGTIHSFCSRVLKEHPLEAGVDPSFRVLQEDESELLRDSTLEQLIEARFEESAIFELLRVYGEHNVGEGIKHVYGMSRVLGMGVKELSAIKPNIDIEAHRNNLIDSINRLQALGKKEEECERTLELTKTKKVTSDLISELRVLRTKFRAQGKAADLIRELQGCFDDWVRIQCEKMAEPSLNAFLDLALNFESKYKTLKLERSALDFGDLENEALMLFKSASPASKAIRKLYQKKFKFLMIDEFQDTSPLQQELVTLLSSEGNLFVVGDWKQSIYGFRGTDVSHFFKVEDSFSKDKTGERMVLAENFRSSSKVLNVINAFFEKIFLEGIGKFESLISSRKEETGSGKAKRVEFIKVAKEEGIDAETARMKEARVLAQKIKSMHEGGSSFKDFAMLFRATKDMYFYEHELRNLDIPYYIVSGRGFYHQPEIRDLMTVLEALENPHIDISLVAVLRSPLVQISDDGLFWIARHAHAGERMPFYQAVQQWEQIKKIGDQDRERLNSFLAWFGELMYSKEKLGTSEVIDLILKKTAYGLYVLGLSQGKRHYANIRKLLEIAREVESRNPVHLGDFVRYVRGLDAQEVRESEAQIEAEEGDVVKLMTVHKAKGLEFPVTILPDLNRKGMNMRGRFLASGENGITMKVWNADKGDFEETYSFAREKALLKEKAREESKRLFYVAMTRAEDHLILSGTTQGSEEEGDPKDNWFGWLEENASFLDEYMEKTIVESVPETKGKRKALPIEKSDIREAVTSFSAIETEQDSICESASKRVEPIRAKPFERIDLPVTAFVTFAHSPKEYLNTYELSALPDANFSEKKEEWNTGEDEAVIGGAEFGTLIHRVFEFLVSNPKLAAKKLKDSVQHVGAFVNTETKDELYKFSKDFIASKEFSEIEKAKVRTPEIPFVLKLRYGIIQGTLDLLYQNESGEWIILDYKSNRITPDEIEATSEEYKTQMMLYALACRELLQIPIRRARLYYTRLNQSFDFDLRGVTHEASRERFEAIQQEIIEARKGLHEEVH